MAKRKPAAIVGHFVNYKPVLGRDVLTLVIEVPSVAAAEVFAALGYPTGGVSIPVAVARLEESASVAKPPQQDVPAPPAPEEPPPPTRLRHWAEMTPAQQTGVIRNEPDFHDFAGTNREASPVDASRNFIRAWCRVESCADILPGTEAAARWAQLQVRYGNWLRQRRGAA